VPTDEAAVFVGRVVTVLCAMEGAVGVEGTEVIVICVMAVGDGVPEVFELGADELAPFWLLVAAGLVLATEESWRFGFWPGKVNLGMEIPTLAHSLCRSSNTVCIAVKFEVPDACPTQSAQLKNPIAKFDEQHVAIEH
jgi:hypothetical protein